MTFLVFFPDLHQERDVLFFGDPSDVEHLRPVALRAVFFEDPFRSVGGVEALPVRPRRQEFAPGFWNADLLFHDVEVGSGAGKDLFETAVELPHDPVGQPFGGGQARLLFDVGGEIRVVGAHRRQSVFVGQFVGDETHGAGGGDVKDVGAEFEQFFLKRPHGRVGNVELFVKGHRNTPAGGEVVDIGHVGAVLGGRRDDMQVETV